jgi:hypothetical protein
VRTDDPWSYNERDKRVTDLPSVTMVYVAASVAIRLSRGAVRRKTGIDYDPAVIVNGYFLFGKQTPFTNNLWNYAPTKGFDPTLRRLVTRFNSWWAYL